MDKKIRAIVIVVIIAIIAVIAIPQYQSYQQEVTSKQFNESLQNASNIEQSIVDKTNQFNNQNSTDADVLITTINNDISPKYSEELQVLNQTEQITSNETEKKYIQLQEKRVQLESKNVNATVTTLNALSKYVKGQRSAEDAQSSIDSASTDLNSTNNELNTVYSDTQKILSENPNLNKKLHDLNLSDAYYGIKKTTQVQNQTTSNTTTQ